MSRRVQEFKNWRTVASQNVPNPSWSTCPKMRSFERHHGQTVAPAWPIVGAVKTKPAQADVGIHGCRCPEPSVTQQAVQGHRNPACSRVRDDGFEFDGARCSRSLPAVARARHRVRGSINGKLFFGLSTRKAQLMPRARRGLRSVAVSAQAAPAFKCAAPSTPASPPKKGLDRGFQHQLTTNAPPSVRRFIVEPASAMPELCHSLLPATTMAGTRRGTTDRRAPRLQDACSADIEAGLDGLCGRLTSYDRLGPIDDRLVCGLCSQLFDKHGVSFVSVSVSSFNRSIRARHTACMLRKLTCHVARPV